MYSVCAFWHDITFPLSTPAIKECLDQMCDIKDLEEHDRTTALTTCGNFDVFLEIGMFYHYMILYMQCRSQSH